MTSSVSTRISRSAVSPTTGAAAGGRRRRSALPAAGGARVRAPALKQRQTRSALCGAGGAGTGLQTAPARDTAPESRERRRGELDVPCLLRGAGFSLRAGLKPSRPGRKGNRIVAGVAQGVAARQSAGRQPAPSKNAVARDRLGGIVRTRRQKSARSPEIWRNAEFIGAKRHQGDAGGSGGQGCCDSRLQGRSGWRRAVRAWARPRRRTLARCCYDEKPLVSVV